MKTETKTKKETTHYLTPLCRVSFCNVWKPREGTETYDMTLIMDQPKDLSEKDKERWNKIKELLTTTKKEKWPKLTAAVTGPVRTAKGFGGEKLFADQFMSDPVDAEKYPEYKDKIILKVTSKGRQPEIIGPDKEEIINKADFYSGCFAIVSVTAFAWENSGKKGVSLGMQHIMKVKDGTPFVGGAGKAADHFEEIRSDDFATTDKEDEDEEDYDL